MFSCCWPRCRGVEEDEQFDPGSASRGIVLLGGHRFGSLAPIPGPANALGDVPADSSKPTGELGCALEAADVATGDCERLLRGVFCQVAVGQYGLRHADHGGVTLLVKLAKAVDVAVSGRLNQLSLCGFFHALDYRLCVRTGR